MVMSFVPYVKCRQYETNLIDLKAKFVQERARYSSNGAASDLKKTANQTQSQGKVMDPHDSNGTCPKEEETFVAWKRIFPLTWMRSTQERFIRRREDARARAITRAGFFCFHLTSKRQLNPKTH